MATVEPIRPDEIRSRPIPDTVIEIFNRLIEQGWNGHRSVVNQRDAADRISTAMEIELGEVFARGLLDVEDTYRQAGWNVVYDKPGFNESYKPHFIFSKPEK